MTLHYLAKRTRSDILTAVSWCASRVLAPTVEDEPKVHRILGYLLCTRDRKTVLRVESEIVLRAYVDASHAVYHKKSVTGVVLMLGNTVIHVKSSKHKIVTLSSTESELVAISDALTHILWARKVKVVRDANDTAGYELVGRIVSIGVTISRASSNPRLRTHYWYIE
jgi:hypothetical protein